MAAFVVGAVFALFLYYATGLTWALVIAFLVCAMLLQVSYAHRLNGFLGGVDPVVTFGTRNLKQLKNVISIPFSITAQNFVAKVMWWAGLVALLVSAGWWY